MLTVCDAGPLHYLIQIGAAPMLPQAFGSLVIPRAVAFELTRPSTPAAVRNWMHAMPAWCSIRDDGVSGNKKARHRGERECILLTKTLQAEFLLIDDRDGRQLALRETDAVVIGTIGALFKISKQRLTQTPSERQTFDSYIELLRQTNFYFSSNLDNILNIVRERLTPN